LCLLGLTDWSRGRCKTMLETVIVILVILWLLGWLVFPIGGGLIHLLLVVVLVVVIIRVLQGRKPLP
jgi:hypothetical protein